MNSGGIINRPVASINNALFACSVDTISYTSHPFADVSNIHQDVKHAHLIYYLAVFPGNIKQAFDPLFVQSPTLFFHYFLFKH